MTKKPVRIACVEKAGVKGHGGGVGGDTIREQSGWTILCKES